MSDSQSPLAKRRGSQSVPKHGEKVSLGQSASKEERAGAEEEAASYNKSYVETGGKPV